MTTWLWPLFEGPCALPDAPGGFGAVRRHDVHTGVDLYTYPGMPVLAVEDGTVVSVEKFTGPDAGSPWWNDTQAVLVEGASGVVVYGEMIPLDKVQVGADVLRGDCLGCVRTVLRQDKGRPTTMLHLELMRPGSRETVWWQHGEEMPACLLDPTRHLERALEERGR